MIETRRYIVSGVVQGVWFRQHTKDCANAIGLRGWVRNNADGNVELVACGDAQQLQQLTADLWKGSPMSDVQSVESQLVEAYTDQDFIILADGLTSSVMCGT